MEDPKVTQLLQKMWDGESQGCNGSSSDFSMMTYLASAPIRKLPGQPLEWESITANNFIAAFKETAFDI